jgi:murein DD-endopeptidase MepM/ murein hydrolase activator NlpD
MPPPDPAARARGRPAPSRKPPSRQAKPRPKASQPSTPPVAPGLARPTAKLVGALAGAALGALLLGSLLGLPTPFGSQGGVAALNANGIPVGSGTAAALYRGPFHPVRGEYDYGEAGAEFGALRSGHIHEGQDIFSKKGTPLVAVRDGVVADRAKASGTYSGGRGNYVVIYNPIENRSYVYFHMLEPAVVDKGERVHAGQLLGLMGCSGSCDGTHLHFEVRRGRASFAADTKAIDPLPFLKGLPQAPEELAEP